MRYYYSIPNFVLVFMAMKKKIPLLKQKHDINLKYLQKFSAVFIFIFSFYWFFFPGEYVLIANHDNNLFITTSWYLNSYLDRPGGIIEYASVFLSQFFRFRTIGALILSGIIMLSYYATFLMFRKNSGNKSFFASGVITIVLLIGMHNNFSHQLYHSLGFIIVMYAVLYVPEDRTRRNLFLILFLPVLYYISGGYLWIFCVSFLVKNFALKEKLSPELIALLTGYPILLVLLAANFIFIYPEKELFIGPFPYALRYNIKFLQYFFILWILLLPLMTRVHFRQKLTNRQPAFILLLLIGAFLVLKFSCSKQDSELFRIEKYAINEDWNGLLRYTKKHPSTNIFGTFYINIALANKGLLCSDLFDYPQLYGRDGLFFGWAPNYEIITRGSDFFWTINYVNEAHHWAFESYILNGFTRRNLTRLIQTELIRENYSVAEMYINVLGKTLFDKRTAIHYRNFLDNPYAIKNDNELGPRMNTNFSPDFFADPNLEHNLRLLLECDPLNRPAFDYLMALYLIETRIEEIARFLPYYVEVTGGEIPILLEESLLVYRLLLEHDKLSGIRISPVTNLRFNNFINISNKYSDPNEAVNALYPSYKSTFWFYLNYGQIQKQ